MSSVKSAAPGALLRDAALERLATLSSLYRLRHLVPRPAGNLDDGPIDLTSNDYLGLTRLPWFQAAARDRLAALPSGAGASRLLGGEHPIFGELERTFSEYKNAESSLYFTSGFAANEGVAGALARLGEEIAFFSDRFNHASLIDGIRLAGLPPSRRAIFQHNDADDLAQALERSTARLKVIFTESVFSMDGDRAPLAAIARLCQEHDAVLVLDEAHAVFCLDHADPEGGRGLSGAVDLPADALITINTCGKAFGAAGALVAGPRWLRDYLINTARSFIYSTGPSPWMAATVLTALAHDTAMGPLRRRLATLGDHLRAELVRLGFDVGASTTAIIPVLARSDERALAWSAFLEERGILARAIRPPTVPDGTARLRLSLSAGLTDGAIERIIAGFEALHRHG